MFRLIALALTLALVAPLAATAQSGDPVTGFATDDSDMNAAMAEAIRTLPLFLANATDAEGYGFPGTSVKVAFQLSDGGAEIIWVGPFLWDGDEAFAGLLANQPNFMGNLNAGDPVEFSLDMVRDWAVQTPDGKLWGHYTTRVIVPRLDPTQAAQLRSLLTPDPVPSAWQ